MTMHISPASSYGTFVMMRIVQVLGLPFLFIPISTLAFMDVPKEKSSKASAVYAMSRNLGGSVGIALLTSYLARHQQIHQSNLANHLVTANTGYRETLAEITATIAAHGHNAVIAGHAAMGRMYHELIHQSSLMAFNDSFGPYGGHHGIVVGNYLHHAP